MHDMKTRHRKPDRREFLKAAVVAGAITGVAPLYRPRRVRAQSAKPHVVILGAGLAGLCSAYELQKRGCAYTILEAEKSHVGGSVRTHHFGDGLYGELGAMRIPNQHAVTMDYVTQFGLPLRNFIFDNSAAFYFARGRRERQRDVDKFRKLYQLGPWERDKSPGDLW